MPNLGLHFNSLPHKKLDKIYKKIELKKSDLFFTWVVKEPLHEYTIESSATWSALIGTCNELQHHVTTFNCFFWLPKLEAPSHLLTLGVPRTNKKEGMSFHDYHTWGE